MNLSFSNVSKNVKFEKPCCRLHRDFLLPSRVLLHHRHHFPRCHSRCSLQHILHLYTIFFSWINNSKMQICFQKPYFSCLSYNKHHFRVAFKKLLFHIQVIFLLIRMCTCSVEMLPKLFKRSK